MRQRPMIWRTALATLLLLLLGSASGGAWAGRLFEYPIELDGVSMARLRGAVPLPRPDTAITVLAPFTYIQLLPPQPHRARFETEAFETGPGYQRSRVGWCVFEQGQWKCSASDRLALADKGIEAGVPTTMATAQALHILDFAMTLAKGERHFRVGSYDHRNRVSVTVGDGCTSTMELQRKGDGFEVVYPEWRNAQACV